MMEIFLFSMFLLFVYLWVGNLFQMHDKIFKEDAKMTKIANGIYKHRGTWIFTDNQGIFVEHYMHLFKTYNDAKLFIDKKIDGSNTREPQIIGEWKEIN